MFKKKNIPTALLLATVLLAGSCEKSIVKETYELILPSDYGKTLAVPDHKFIMAESLGGTTVYGQAPVFGDIYSIAGVPATKAGITLSEIPFVDLLDIDRIEEQNIDGVSVTQIPFKASIDYQEMALQYTGDENPWTSSRRYFVFTEDADGCFAEIVTLIPTAQMLQAFGPNSFSYLDRSRFDGIVLHSDLEGNFVSVTSNRAGPAYIGELRNTEAASEDAILMEIPVLAETKAYGGSLDASYCVAIAIEKCMKLDKTNGWNPAVPSHGDWENGDDSNPEPPSGGGGGNGGDNGFKGDPILRSVTIYQEGQGTTTGSGSYAKGYVVNITATGQGTYTFVRWEGDFQGRDGDFTYTVINDVTSKAVFRDNKSCYDKETGTYSVINSYKIAASGKYGNNLKGGMYGYTRWNEDGSQKFHHGIDIAAEEGTPVFAPKDGKVIRIIEDIPDGPKGAAISNTGNEIRLKCGNETYVYMHLRSKAHGGGIAPGLTVGSEVTSGQLIGWTGATGNAFNVPNKHLHLQVEVNGETVDPESYINGTINKENGTITVACDSEYSDNPDDNGGKVWDNTRLYW